MNAPDYGLNLVPEITGIDRPEMQPAVARILNVERAQLQSLFNLAPGFVAVSFGKRHVFQMVNDAYYQLIGHRDVIGKSLWDALPEVAGQGFDAIMDNVLASGQPLVLRAQKVALQRTPNGPLEERYLDLLYHPIRSTEGKVTGIFSQGYDVTEMREANRRLAEKIQELEAARSRQAFQVQIADRIHHLENPDDVVAVASELLGTHLGVARVVYAVVDASGEHANMKPDWTDGILPSLAGLAVRLDDFGPLVANAIGAGKTLAIADVTTDERSAAHAHIYAAKGVRSLVGIPLMKAGTLRATLNLHDSRPRHWTEHEIALAQDMVDRTWSAVESARAQADLRVERDQSRYIFDSMTEGFGLVDKNWTVLQMNAEGLRITQRTAHEVIGKNHWDVWSELKGTRIEEVYRQVLATGKADIFDLPFIFPDNRRGWVEIRVYPSLNGGLALFFRDISERIASQEKLKDANRRKDEFLAMLAHELRNPLAPISAAAELMQMVKLDEERMRQTSQIIGRQVAHMTALVDDLLDVSRVTRGLVELDTASIDINQIITDAIEQATPLIRSRQHHLGMRLAADATLVLGDKKRLVQVLANLLSNAAKYTPEGGHILIRTEVRPAHVLIQISDDGNGMAPELVGRAFDLFAQAERTSDRSSGGLGLGLALVKSLVEHHHGTVTCESPGLGRGSTFTICLPRLLSDDYAKDAQAAPLTPQQNSKALRIMVVDDNMDAAAMLAMLLEALGHKVLVEHGARQALERAKLDSPQVFLLDIGLPEMDGNELANRLRAQPETADAVLIAITGYGQDSDRGRALAAGFDHHLVKPVDTAKLVAILAKAT